MKDERLPIATATVARLCLAQGRLAQAEALFRHLLDKHPEDPQLSQGLAEVLRRKATERPAPTGDSVTVEREGDRLRCHWSMSEAGHRRAQLVCEEPGQLLLRVHSFAPQEQKPADTKISEAVGSLLLEPSAGASLVVAAIGLLDSGGGFVSIAHSPPLRLDDPAGTSPAAPAKPQAAE